MVPKGCTEVQAGFSNGCFLEHPTLSLCHVPVPFGYLLGFLILMANFMPGKCWFAGSRFVEMCQLCWDSDGEMHGPAPRAWGAASLSPTPQSEIFWDSVRNAWIPGVFYLASGWEKAENTVFSKGMGCVCSRQLTLLHIQVLESIECG